MIPETDVDDTQCSEQIVDIRPLKFFHSTFHWSVSRTNRRTDRRHASTTSGEEDCQSFRKSRNDWRTHSTNHRMSQDRIQQRTVEQVVNAQVQQVENPVEVKKHKIIQTKVQRRNPIIHDKGLSLDQTGRDFPDSAHSTFLSRRKNGCSNRYQRSRRCKRLSRCQV